MESPFHRNRRWYQQPDRTGHPFPLSPSFYHVDPTIETQRPFQRPAERSSGPKVVQIPVHFVGSKQLDRTGSAVKIQKVFRGFLVRKCVMKIKGIKAQVDEIEEKLRKSEVIELVRRNQRERLRMNESLMSLLFKLDSICGLDFGVRVCRKAVIKKAIALQEMIDAIVAAEGNGENGNHEAEIRAPEEIGNHEAEIRASEEIGNHEVEIRAPEENCNHEAEIRVPEENDHLTSPTGSSEDMEDNVECGENLVDVNCAIGNDNNSMKVEGEDGVTDVQVDCEVKVGESKEAGDSVAEGLKDETQRNRELLEKMKGDSEKMLSLMNQLFEKNETQTRLINALTHRVDLLEKAIASDRLRKKKKAKAAGSK